MVRRRKNDKRVLTGRPNNQKSNKRFKRRRSPSQPVPVRQKKRKKQRSGKTVALMILVLLAFVVGAGIGTYYIFHFSFVGPLLLVLLFLGSSSFQEGVSASKYPEYSLYLAHVSKYIPFRKYRPERYKK